MTQESPTRTRPAWAGCAFAAVAVTAVAAIAVMLWLAFATSAFFDKPDIPDEEKLGKKAGLTEYRLRQALSDGQLTESEAAYAATGPWDITRDGSTVRIVVSYEPGPTCYRFKVTTSSDPSSAVQRTQLDHCPALPRKPAQPD
ncbi:hypothetical protein AB0J38_05175 [Streptomyces sp. NPDC050095]|uniref:hypothetical protein n=1 Tax=unclassified Streptomyces TaxID=2593676 RepID=UPI0034173C4C